MQQNMLIQLSLMKFDYVLSLILLPKVLKRFERITTQYRKPKHRNLH